MHSLRLWPGQQYKHCLSAGLAQLSEHHGGLRYRQESQLSVRDIKGHHPKLDNQELL